MNALTKLLQSFDVLDEAGRRRLDAGMSETEDSEALDLQKRAARLALEFVKVVEAVPTLDAAGRELVAEALEEGERLTGTIRLQKSGGGRRATRPREAEGLRRAFRKGNLRVTDLLHGRVRDVTPDGEPILAGR